MSLRSRGTEGDLLPGAPDPYSDFNDPCPQPPSANHPVALLHVHNDCDIVGICQSAEEFHEEVRMRLPDVDLAVVKIDFLQQQRAECVPECARSGDDENVGVGLDSTLGSVNHGRWPFLWTEKMLAFLGARPKAP